MEYKCDYCSIFKLKTEYYKNNLSKCKECIKHDSSVNRINKNIIFKMLQDIYANLNSNNIYLNDILLFMKQMKEEINIIKSTEDFNSDNEKLKIETKINKILEYNKNIDEYIKTIKNKSDLKMDEDYEKRLKEILED